MKLIKETLFHVFALLALVITDCERKTPFPPDAVSAEALAQPENFQIWENDYSAEIPDDFSRTGQNEIIALKAEIDPETIRKMLDEKRILIEPAGWSRNGIFAYRTAYDYPDIPSGGYSLIIYDTVTNEFIEKDNIPTYGPGAKYPDEEEIARIKTRWARLLERYRIAGEIEAPLAEINEGGYQRFEDKNMECRFDYEASYSQWAGGISEEINYSLILEKNGRRKTIDTGAFFSLIDLGKRIIGFCESPYENRIVIFTLGCGKYYNGVTVSQSLHGCDMDAGFE
jgi:hypothetical protein